METNVEPKLVWLGERLVLDDKSLSLIIQRMPQLLCLDHETNLKPTLEWLGERLVLDDKSLSSVIQRMPSLLGCNIDTNLEPTIRFHEDCVGSDAARKFIANNPAMLTYSLEIRLKPRLSECQEAGIPIDTGTLRRMAKYTEDR